MGFIFLMYLLDPEEISFPNPMTYHPLGGLIAAGGDLAPEHIWLAYSLGIFPWYNPGEEILWWCPEPRFVLFPEELKVSKSMRKILNNKIFEITEDKAFETVMRQCGNVERPGQDGSWISEELVQSFLVLHREGKAKSIEVWENNALVGGLYGLIVNRVFCGESMFSKVSNASKAGFLNFVEDRKEDFDLIDCQIHSDHLESLGARMIPKLDFLNVLYK